MIGALARRQCARLASFAIGTAVAVAATVPLHAAAGDDDAGLVDDPFTVATRGLAGCPVPKHRRFTREEALAEAHGRSQRGVSCYLDGRCRLPSAYLYDREIVPRVVIAANADDRLATTSVWVLGSRRWVWLKGCVSSEAQRTLIEERVRRIDDVEQVVNELMVGTAGRPQYEIEDR